MTLVNEVGVDPNRLLEHPHTVALLQFVCGLGPRKASSLLKVFFSEQTANKTNYLQNKGILKVTKAWVKRAQEFGVVKSSNSRSCLA